MLNRAFVLVVATLSFSSAIAQTSSAPRVAGVSGDGGTKYFERIEKAGRLFACELHYSYAFHDDRDRAGATILVTSLLTATMSKAPTFVLYETTAASEISRPGSPGIKAKKLSPGFMSLNAGGASLERFAFSGPPLSCAAGSLCKEFVDDSKADLLRTLLNSASDQFEFVVAMKEDGIERRVDFSMLEELDRSMTANGDSTLSFLDCVKQMARMIAGGSQPTP